MSNPNTGEPELISSPTTEENKQLANNFTFTLTCPKCQATLTSQDFDQNHFTIAHLQAYFHY